MPLVSLSPPTSTLSELGGSAIFTVNQNEKSGFDTSIVLAFGGSAVLNTDYSVSGITYTPGTMTLVIPAGQTSAAITLTGLNNPNFLSDQTATISIASVTNGAAQGGPFDGDDHGDPGAGGFAQPDRQPDPRDRRPGHRDGDHTGGGDERRRDQPALHRHSRSGHQLHGFRNLLQPRGAIALTIPAGSTSSTLVLQAVDDGKFGPNLGIVVSVQSVTGGIAPGGPVTATITEGDPMPSVSLSASALSIPDNGGQSTVTATLSAAAAVPITVPLAFSGTAVLNTNYSVSGVSYNATTMSIVIPAGQTSGAIVITGIPRNEYGPNLTLGIAVTSAGPPVTGSAVNLTITSSTPAPQLIVNSISANENNPSAIFNVLLSQASLLPVTLVYNTFDETAIGGVNYTSTSGTVDHRGRPDLCRRSPFRF